MLTTPDRPSKITITWNDLELSRGPFLEIPVYKWAQVAVIIYTKDQGFDGFVDDGHDKTISKQNTMDLVKVLSCLD